MINDVDAGNAPCSTPQPSFLACMQRKLHDYTAQSPEQPQRPTTSPLQPRTIEERLSNELRRTGVLSDGYYEGSLGRDFVASLTPAPNDSPLSRAGLLQPRSYNASIASGSLTRFMHPHGTHLPGLPHTHSQDTIRQATMELSALPGPSSYVPTPPNLSRAASVSSRLDTTREEGSFIFPQPELATTSTGSRESSLSPLTQSTSSLRPPSVDSKLESSIPSLDSLGDVTTHSATSSEDGRATKQSRKPSGLSLLRPLSSSSSSAESSSSPSPPLSQTDRQHQGFSPSDATPTPTATPRPPPRQLLASPPTERRSRFGRSSEVTVQNEEVSQAHPHVHWRDPSHSPERSALSHSLRGPSSPLAMGLPALPHETTRSDERTPLLSALRRPSPPDSGTPPLFLGPASNKAAGLLEEEKEGPLRSLRRTIAKLDPLSPAHIQTALRSIPAVLLGSLLNILDGVSYGMIIFPATGVFSGLGPMGVSMFFVSAIVAQLVYTFGGSGFAGGNGSMMIEVVPFFHILANDIAGIIGDENPEAIIATTLVAFAFSSLLTGLVFFLLGALKLGVIVGFFPRHILVGCIGGVGVFLMITGFAVSMRIPDDDFTFSLETLRLMFLETHNLVLWALPLALAVLLRVVTHHVHHQLVFPLYFIVIPLIFYVVVAAGQFDFGMLRKEGWLFDVSTAREPWYHFYSYLNFNYVWWSALWATMPTQFALLFFNILHPPLNVPALAVSLDMDLNTDKELVAHGYSNLLAGLIGTVPNYLVYVNTLLFYRVGGTTRIASFLLAVATCGLLWMGTGPIAYLPVMVVGALIFVLGIDLVKEALWDTRHRTSRFEYITIVSIMVCMTMWDFVIGVLFGIVVSCFFFVVQNSHRRSIRSIFTGDTAMSAVRRPNFQRAYIREVAKQTTVLRLQGFLFFGTITYVEEAIRELIDGPSYALNPVQFLVLDFTYVAGVDMSSAEALVRVQRLLAAKCVTLVLCGFEVESAIGRALESVGVLAGDRVELFATFNDAMEWTENIYLRTWYRTQKSEVSSAFAVPLRREVDDARAFIGSFVASPRRSHIREAGDRTIANAEYVTHHHQGECGTFSPSAEPLNTILKAFSSFGPVDPAMFGPVSLYLERIPVPAGYVLWRQGDPADGLYLIQSGLLKAYYKFDAGASSPYASPPSGHPNNGYGGHAALSSAVGAAARDFEETMVAGTVAGELSTISDTERNCTVVVERAGVVWKMGKAALRRMQVEQPELARVFVQFALKVATIDYDILLTAMASRQ